MNDVETLLRNAMQFLIERGHHKGSFQNEGVLAASESGLCALGALNLAVCGQANGPYYANTPYAERKEFLTLTHLATFYLDDSLPDEHKTMGTSANNVMKFNDDDATTFDDIVALFVRAIETAHEDVEAVRADG